MPISPNIFRNIKKQARRESSRQCSPEEAVVGVTGEDGPLGTEGQVQDRLRRGRRGGAPRKEEGASVEHLAHFLHLLQILAVVAQRHKQSVRDAEHLRDTQLAHRLTTRHQDQELHHRVTCMRCPGTK